MLGEFAFLLGSFAVVSGLAELLGAANIGSALTFGQIGCCVARVPVLLRR